MTFVPSSSTLQMTSEGLCNSAAMHDAPWSKTCAPLVRDTLLAAVAACGHGTAFRQKFAPPHEPPFDLLNGSGMSSVDRDLAVQQIVSRSTISITTPDISILSDEFLPESSR